MRNLDVEETFKACKFAKKEVESLKKEITYAKHNDCNILLPILENRIREEEKLQADAETMLSMISPEDAVLMRLYFIDRQPTRRVAYELGISQKTFFRRKKRILKELQEKYNAIKHKPLNGA